jgi:hypothetical protein
MHVALWHPGKSGVAKEEASLAFDCGETVWKDWWQVDAWCDRQ